MTTKIFFLSSFLLKLVKSEGYYCPYMDLGSNGSNDLLYDYYKPENNYWVKMGETGWITREQYCNDKADFTKHSDAGQAKCEDSQGTCVWENNSCMKNTNKEPDCKELCETILNNGGLECLGECPGGISSREEIYNICKSNAKKSNVKKSNVKKSNVKSNKRLCKKVVY